MAKSRRKPGKAIARLTSSGANLPATRQQVMAMKHEPPKQMSVCLAASGICLWRFCDFLRRAATRLGGSSKICPGLGRVLANTVVVCGMIAVNPGPGADNSALAATPTGLIAGMPISGKPVAPLAKELGARAVPEMLSPLELRMAKPSSEVPDFQRHVVPLLGRLGCNGRACHGSFQGQGKFTLSLFGYDFAADHAALTAVSSTRAGSQRVDLKNPANSFILLKPTEAIEHGGGERFTKDSWQYRALEHWIAAGAPEVKGRGSQLASLELIPNEKVFFKLDEKFQLRVIAHWQDGSSEDVTCLCRFHSNDDSIADVDEAGLVTCTGRGDSHIVASYDQGVVTLPVMLPWSNSRGAAFPDIATTTKIDELVIAKLRKVGIVPAPLCKDEEFLRRASLDITGTLPRGREILAFCADPDPAKRAKKVDELLARPEYAVWWTTKLCDYTGANPRTLTSQRRGTMLQREWFEWLYDRVARNMPYDKIVSRILLATSVRTGQSYTDFCDETCGYYGNDPIGQFRNRETMPHFWTRLNIVNKPDEMALAVSYSFLGIQLQCAQCHKHPFDRWSKQDFKDFSALFNRVGFGVDPNHTDEREQLTRTLPEGVDLLNSNLLRRIEISLIRDGATMPYLELFVRAPAKTVKTTNAADANPKGTKALKVKSDQLKKATVVAEVPLRYARILGGPTVDLATAEDPRQSLMRWMCTEPNHTMARAFVNRVWASYFNTGIISPTDDMSQANPPSNGPLLDYLTTEFVRHNYDMRWLHREIALSDTYQRGHQTNESNRLDTRNFSHSIPRRLPAEVASDALVRATSSRADLQVYDAEPQERLIGMNRVGKDESGLSDKETKPNYALTVFGQPVRLTNCDCERSNSPSLLQSIYVQNDQNIWKSIDRPGGWLMQTLAQLDRERIEKMAKDSNPTAQKMVLAADSVPMGKKLPMSKKQAATRPMRQAAIIKKHILTEPALIGVFKASEVPAASLRRTVNQLYLRTVSRLPSNAEMARILEHLDDAENVRVGLRDAMWAMLNTKEFIVNH